MEKRTLLHHRRGGLLDAGGVRAAASLGTVGSLREGVYDEKGRGDDESGGKAAQGA
ncbi:MAG: hypothetical protein AAB295_09685 [Chloroflexota bacterium]